jgi:cellulose synthase/poly-beta-1,6-N-acetylglucosamine synthase-like glycosyltransferase
MLFLTTFWLIVLVFEDEKEKKLKMTRHPFFTAIVPAYNEQESIVETIKSLVALKYPRDKVEILVINDGSTDNTKKVVEDYLQQNPQIKHVKLINKKNGGKGTALNLGLKSARGEFFACLDADSFIESNALEVMLPYFLDDDNLGALCPLMKIRHPKNIKQKVQWIEYIINMFYKHLNSKIDCIHVTPGPFSIYRTAIIRKLGYFSTKTITEDLEIALRLQKHNYKIKQIFETTVETIAPETWIGIFKQRLRWYKGSVDNTIDYRELMFNKKYGDFGYLRMPTIIISGVMAIILAGALLSELTVNLVNWFKNLKAVNFDILTLIRNWEFHFNYLTLPFFKIVIAITLFSLSFFIMVYSFKIVKEKITNHGKTLFSMITYLFLYGLLITSVWFYIGIMYITKKKNRWYK